MFERGNPYKFIYPSGHFAFDFIDRIVQGVKNDVGAFLNTVHNAVQNVNEAWQGSLAQKAYDRTPIVKDMVDVMFGLEALNNGDRGFAGSHATANQRIENGIFGLISLGAFSASAAGSNLIKTAGDVKRY
ncbi:hypothetical protein JW826_02500 [Candidatus Woesearchaeota archaeon]|nr:hypothetical protein [Candidatus Woesearchaeota archaeon]